MIQNVKRFRAEGQLEPFRYVEIFGGRNVPIKKGRAAKAV